TVYLVKRGANYGYSLREGNELLKPDNSTAPLPPTDEIPLQIGERPAGRTLVPVYPVIEYGHTASGGDAIGSGFVYAGKAIPALRGKYIFSDLTTGRIWWADYKDMLAADDGKPATLAAIHEVKLRWNGQTYDTMFPIAEASYKARGGRSAK